MKINFNVNLFWHRIAKLGFWKLYDNTLNPIVNSRYIKYGKICRKKSPSSFPIGMQPWPFRNDSLELVKNVITKDESQRMSDMITNAIEEGCISANASIPYHYDVVEPVDFFGESILDIFDGALGDKLCDLYGSYFQLEWLDCYRTFPGLPDKSWLWHIDNYPPFVVKVLLYITDSNEENGITRILSMKKTREFFNAGYFGVYNDERKLHLSQFSADHNINYVEDIPERDSSDAIIFSTSTLHKAGEVKSGYRDVMSFLLLPSVRPWREVYEDVGKSYIHQASGFPSNPLEI
jgi:hypothetical protein